MELKNKIIILVSNEPWGEIWYSKHNWANELSKNNRILFVDPPENWKLKNLFYIRISLFKVTNQLQVIRYSNYIPVTKITRRINNYIISKKLNRFIRKQTNDKIVFWSFDPIRLWIPKYFNPELSVFHVVDQLDFIFYGEKKLCEQSDFILTVSKRFIPVYNLFPAKIIYVPHAVPNHFFHITEEDRKVFDIPFTGYGLYVGAIDKRIDYILLEKVIMEFPDEKFVFIGPLNIPDNEIARRIFSERSYPNVYCVGPRPFNNLKVFIEQSKFCISFMEDYKGNTIGHHKTMLYLSQGKPIFSFHFSDYIDLNELMYMSKSHDTILSLLSEFLLNGEDELLITKRINYSKQFGFNDTIKNLLSQITTHTA